MRRLYYGRFQEVKKLWRRMNIIECKEINDSLNSLDDCVGDLAIIDPPYFSVCKEEWDNKWASLEQYLEWTNGWVGSLYRSMRFGGSVYLYGCSKNLLTLSAVGSQMVRCGFEFRQEIIIDKGMKSASGGTSQFHKCFPMVSENILYMVKDAKPFVKSILKQKQLEKGFSAKQMNEVMGFKSNGGGNWTKYAGDTNFPLLPTEDHWNKLRAILEIDVPYHQIGTTFNTEWGITNVWNDIEFYGERTHPTEKPIQLAERLIKVSSNYNDLILDLFCGTGNVSLVSKDLGRRSVAVDNCEAYCNIARRKLGVAC